MSDKEPTYHVRNCLRIRMPQIFQVLRCYKCLVFQVHQTKKSNKFECKMCGEKQSIKRHYGLGNGQECRKHVQKLNGIRGEIDEVKSSQSISADDEDDDLENVMPILKKQKNEPSKWSEYVKTHKSNEPNDSDNDEMYLNNKEVVLELPQKHRKILKKNYGKKQSAKISHDDNDDDDDSVQATEVYPALPSHFASTCSNTQRGNSVKNTYTPSIKNETCLAFDYETPHSLKWEEPNNETSNSVQTDMSNSQTNVKKFISPAVDKNSKWAKYAEDDNENEIEDTYFCENRNRPHDAQALFSLCDENDLDEYLAI